MIRRIKHMQLHAVPFVEGCGQLKSILSIQNYTGMTLLWTPSGVIVDYNKISFIIPLANIIVATFVDAGVAAEEQYPAASQAVAKLTEAAVPKPVVKINPGGASRVA